MRDNDDKQRGGAGGAGGGAGVKVVIKVEDAGTHFMGVDLTNPTLSIRGDDRRFRSDYGDGAGVLYEDDDEKNYQRVEFPADSLFAQCQTLAKTEEANQNRKVIKIGEKLTRRTNGLPTLRTIKKTGIRQRYYAIRKRLPDRVRGSPLESATPEAHARVEIFIANLSTIDR